MSEIVTIADAHGTICTLNLNQATHVEEVQQKLRIALNGDPRPVQEVKVIVWKVFTELRDKYINKSPEFFTQAVFRTLLSQAPIGVGLGPRGHSLLMEAVRYNESCMAALLNVHNKHPHRFPLDKHLRSQDGKFPFHVAARDYPAIALQLLDSVTDYALAGSAVSGFPLMACLIDDIFNGIHTGPVHCQLTRCLLQPCFDLRFPLIGYESAACVEVRSLSGQLQKECRTPEQLFEKYMRQKANERWWDHKYGYLFQYFKTDFITAVKRAKHHYEMLPRVISDSTLLPQVLLPLIMSLVISFTVL